MTEHYYSELFDTPRHVVLQQGGASFALQAGDAAMNWQFAGELYQQMQMIRHDNAGSLNPVPV